ncbi:hypothetical protein T484DRAFT_1782103 [Baffinella frigidus]|nr:hypothetical protein T484DRAFT_1782103 [Cryptophyta sp. CCMP2293]
MTPTAATAKRLAGMKLRDYHRHPSLHLLLDAGLHPTLRPTPDEMETTSSCPELQRKLLIMSLQTRLRSCHTISSFVAPSKHVVETEKEAPSNSSQNGDGDEQDTSKPTPLARGSTLPSILPSRHVTFADIDIAPARSASARDIATAPARRLRWGRDAPVRTSRPPALVELEHPGSRKQALRPAPLRQRSFMQHTYTSRRDLELMLAFKKEELTRRGGSSGVREVGSIDLLCTKRASI